MTLTLLDIQEKFAKVNNNLSLGYVQNSGILERVFFEYAGRLNPGLVKNMPFPAKNQVRSVVENGRFILCYYAWNNIDDFKRLAAIYASAFPQIDARVTDYRCYQYQSESIRTVYFALSLDVRVVLKQVIAVMHQKPSAAQTNNPQVPAEDIEYEPKYSEDHVYSCHSELQEQKIARANSEKLVLIDKIDSLCRDSLFWSGKIRLGCGVELAEGGIVPSGIFQIIRLIETHRTVLPHEQLLEKIGTHAADKHSDNFQLLHAFFRGQDGQTNEVYGVLKDLATTFSCDTISQRLERFVPESGKKQSFGEL